ncbi:PhoX family phosphatase [Aeromonas sp. SrichE-2G]|uniref:PhoX family protein n=1 Tax=Aeromonas sp. SrichE-2G TaxID=2823359 RepID=UPI001B330CF6|nr:PhoX family phosphatase [Aeromonas sp. SrichE-2G]MBP4041971.1 PhoX family phosphatase [Aeromonas sp. SrichE-2G]
MSRFDEKDSANHPREQEPAFNRLIEAGLSRRGFLKGVGAASMVAFFAASPVAQAVAAATRPLLGFQAVPASVADTIVVPPGYKAEVLIAWGDALFPDAPAFAQSNDAKAQARQFGDNNDGMSFFSLGPDSALLAVNNEYTNYEYLFEDGGKALSAGAVAKAQAAHGVSLVELARIDGKWQANPKGALNRRITATTPMTLSGPAAGHALLKTQADPEGRTALGTFNNCANGQTPWGTYLTCEENFNGYFGSEGKPVLDQRTARYGLAAEDAGFGWYKFDERFDLAKHPQEPHRFGWVVEIDPRDPASTPKKRTALGRFKHENAAFTINQDGRAVVYLGDDERGEHIYRFVSKNKVAPGNDPANRDLLDEGTLYVARFEAREGELKGTGQWLPLVHGEHGLTRENGFADQGEVLIFAREAATRLGATTMDRPEWVAVHPHRAEVYCTLTNNKNRGIKENQPLDGANPRAENPYGQIIRWRPMGDDHGSDSFEWDLFLLAGNPGVHKEGLMAGSANIHPDNMFNSPDGIGFDEAGRLWIQTDGDYSNEKQFAGMGNNQMLCADPASGEVRRFLTGPVACEITGLTFTPDWRTLFVGVQHPGEEGAPSHFPDGGTAIPRSAVLRITRDDGGIIGA